MCLIVYLTTLLKIRVTYPGIGISMSYCRKLQLSNRATECITVLSALNMPRKDRLVGFDSLPHSGLAWLMLRVHRRSQRSK